MKKNKQLDDKINTIEYYLNSFSEFAQSNEKRYGNILKQCDIVKDLIHTKNYEQIAKSYEFDRLYYLITLFLSRWVMDKHQLTLKLVNLHKAVADYRWKYAQITN